ncbi:MAG: L,D-transpeptidase [Gemmatimonadaceae bacterium]
MKRFAPNGMMSRFSILVFASACAIGTWGCAYASHPIAAGARPQGTTPHASSLSAVGFVRLTEVHAGVAASELRIPVRLSRTLAAMRASQYSLSDRSRLRLVVSLNRRLLSAVAGKDTVFRAQVGVATGLRLAFAGRSWRFRTPRGTRRVLRKTEDPVWTPPDWHYAETAFNHRLRLAHLPSKGVVLSTGAKLVIRDRVVGIIYPGRAFAMLPTDEHLVFDGRVFIPPVGTLNRRVTESLGDYALDLGGGYLIHGTSNEASIGEASSHGCIRVRHEDIEWLFDNVPVGTPVLIH